MPLLFPKNDWLTALAPVFKDPNTKALFQKVDELYQQEHVLPEDENAVFKALTLTPYARTKVVIIGQDPYPNPRNAVGLSFSVAPGVSVPQSLQNIFKERQSDLGIPPTDNGDLTTWARQGVLLLNATLTVQAGQSNSHANLGWHQFTDAIIRALNHKSTPLVYLLWGRFAQEYETLIMPKETTLILKSPHPSPFSANRGFFGSRPFSQVNKFLQSHGATPIDWRN